MICGQQYTGWRVHTTHHVKLYFFFSAHTTQQQCEPRRRQRRRRRAGLRFGTAAIREPLRCKQIFYCDAITFRTLRYQPPTSISVNAEQITLSSAVPDAQMSVARKKKPNYVVSKCHLVTCPQSRRTCWSSPRPPPPLACS